MSKTKVLRDAIYHPDILVMPGVFDGFSTRLVEHFGYPSAFITGSGVSESRLGQVDVGIMGLEENVAGARAMVACSNLALLADGDTGYGNAVNAYYTIKGFEQAGVAGVMLEDQQPVVAQGVGQQGPLRFEGDQRLDIVPHDPR